MGKELYNTYPVAKAVFDEADKLLGFSFSKKLFETDSTEIIEPLKELISSFEITFPKGKVYCNVTGKAYKSVDEIYEYLPIQVRECVRFYDIACEMIEDGSVY